LAQEGAQAVLDGPRRGRQVAHEALQGGRAPGGLGVAAADVGHVLDRHGHHDVDVVERPLVELGAAVLAGLEAQ
jgi:hypothetical protein